VCTRRHCVACTSWPPDALICLLQRLLSPTIPFLQASQSGSETLLRGSHPARGEARRQTRTQDPEPSVPVPSGCRAEVVDVRTCLTCLAGILCLRSACPAVRTRKRMRGALCSCAPRPTAQAAGRCRAFQTQAPELTLLAPQARPHGRRPVRRRGRPRRRRARRTRPRLRPRRTMVRHLDVLPGPGSRTGLWQLTGSDPVVCAQRRRPRRPAAVAVCSPDSAGWSPRVRHCALASVRSAMCRPGGAQLTWRVCLHVGAVYGMHLLWSAWMCLALLMSKAKRCGRFAS